MKKKLLITILLLLISSMLAIFSACQVEESKLKSMTLSEGCPTQFVTGNFDVSKYSFVLTYKDGKTKVIECTEDMFSSADYLKTYKEGKQTLTAKYLNMSCTFEVDVKKYEFSFIEFLDKECTYTGENHTLEVSGMLPEGTKITYPSGNTYKDAGDYTVCAVLTNESYVTTTIYANLKIKKATYVMTNVDFKDATFTYDGTPKTIAVSNVPNGLKVSYSYNNNEFVGIVNASENPYIITASFDAGPNYMPIQNKTAKLTINKAIYDVSLCKLNDKSFVYDGKYHGLVISNADALPKGVTVSYKNNSQKYVGEYEVEAVFTGDANNYEPIKNKKAKLTITKAKYELTTVTMDNEIFTYDKKPHYISYSGSLSKSVAFARYEYYELNDNEEIVKKVDAMIDAGKYQVRALFNYIEADKANYQSVDPLTAIVEITKADIDFAVFNDTTYEYDRFAHSIYVSNLPDGVNVKYTNNTQTEVGVYEIYATFSFESGSKAERNYNLLTDMSAKMEIVKASLGSKVSDLKLEYSGKDYSVKVSDWVVNKQVLGKSIVLMNGEDEMDGYSINEALPEGVSIYYSYMENNIEKAFVSMQNPGSVVMYANYYTESETVANDCSKYYVTDSITKTNITINSQVKSVYILAKKSRVFEVVKKEYKPTLLNQLSTYSGSNIEVVVDVSGDKIKYPNLAFDTGYETTGGIYNNNTKKEIGIYSGSVLIKLSSEALNYYTVSSSAYTFKYAIADENKTLFDPGILDKNSETFDETKIDYSLKATCDIPKGIVLHITNSETIQKPKSYFVTVSLGFEDDNDPSVIGDGDIARFFYKFPSQYIEGADGSYTTVVLYTINKKLYDLDFTGTYKYDGEAKLPEAINCPDWIIVSYSMDLGDGNIVPVSLYENQIILPSATPYTLIAKLEIINSTMAEYYYVSEEGKQVTMTINKGDFRDYIVTGERVKYDGKLHNIIIKGLPEGITYTTTLGEGRKEVGEYNDIIVYFENNSDCYNDLANIKVNMVIENNYVEKGAFQTYCDTPGNKVISMFTSLRELLGGNEVLSGATLEWSVDYYDGLDMFPLTDTTRHGSSQNMQDFTFVESTKDNENAIVKFKIKLNEGYVFNDNILSKEYAGQFTVVVTEKEKIDIDSILEISNNKEVIVEQNSTIDNLILNYIPVNAISEYELTYWKADYYYSKDLYASDYPFAHGEMSDVNSVFTFELNTWGERYCLVTYTITASDDYCFSCNGQSYQSYTGTVKCLVTEKITKLDNYDLQLAIDKSNSSFKVNRYSYFKSYIDELIDTKYVSISYSLRDKDDENLNTNNEDIVIDFESFEDDYSLDLSITLNSGITGLIFGTNKNKVEFSNYEVVFDNDHLIDVDSIFNMFALAGIGTQDNPMLIDQYVQPAKQQKAQGLLDELLNNSYPSFIITYPDGTQLIGTTINDNTSVSVPTEGDELAVINWTYTARKGNYFINKETNLRSNVAKYTFYFKVLPIELVEITDLVEKYKEEVYVNQYSDIADDIGSRFNPLKEELGDKFKISVKGNYYIDTEKYTSGNVFNIDNGKIEGIFDLATTNSKLYFYAVINLEFVSNSGYVFDTFDTSYTFTIKYQVKPREVFTEAKLDEYKFENKEDEKELATFKSTIIQSIVNSLALNKNLLLTGWKVCEVVDNVEGSYTEGTNLDVYEFNKTGIYNVKLNFVTNESYCVLVDGKGVEKFEIEFRLVVNDLI